MSSENGPANSSSKLSPQSHRQSGWSASSARNNLVNRVELWVSSACSSTGRSSWLGRKAGRRRSSALSFSSGDEGRTYRRVSHNRQKSR
jgi:hypothetical protein